MLNDLDDGDYIMCDYSNGTFFGTYMDNGQDEPTIRLLDVNSGNHFDVLVTDVGFPRLAERFNPRNTKIGDRVEILGEEQRVVARYVQHGVNLVPTVPKISEPHFVSFAIITQNFSESDRKERLVDLMFLDDD